MRRYGYDEDQFRSAIQLTLKAPEKGEPVTHTDTVILLIEVGIIALYCLVSMLKR